MLRCGRYPHPVMARRTPRPAPCPPPLGGAPRRPPGMGRRITPPRAPSRPPRVACSGSSGDCSRVARPRPLDRTVRLTPTGVALPPGPQTPRPGGGGPEAWRPGEPHRLLGGPGLRGLPPPPRAPGSAGGRCFPVRARPFDPGGLLRPRERGAPWARRSPSWKRYSGSSPRRPTGIQPPGQGGGPYHARLRRPDARTSGEDPLGDTLSKVRCVAPVVGRVLDTYGLGYTAIVAAGSGSARGRGAGVDVLTIEIDPGAVAVARLNPWSPPLRAPPHRAPDGGTAPRGKWWGLPGQRASPASSTAPVLSRPAPHTRGPSTATCTASWAAEGSSFHSVATPRERVRAAGHTGRAARLHGAGFSAPAPPRGVPTWPSVAGYWGQVGGSSWGG